MGVGGGVGQGNGSSCGCAVNVGKMPMTDKIHCPECDEFYNPDYMVYNIFEGMDVCEVCDGEINEEYEDDLC